MKKIFFLSILTAVFAALIVSYGTICTATGIDNYGPAQIVSQNPIQSGVITQTNQTPATYTNTVTFPFPFPSNVLPVTGYVWNFSTNAANETLVTTWTSTNLTIVSTATNTTFGWQAFQAVPRLQSGILGLGSFVSGAVICTNVFASPFVNTPVVTVTGSGSLYATNAGLWLTSVTSSNFVVATGNTNQIIYWNAIGATALPGVNTPTQ